MKINNIIRLVSFCFSAVAVLSCEVAENLDEHTAETLVHKIFHATIEDGGMTKTTLAENAVDGVRGLMWDPCDEIGIGIHGSTFRKFTNICAEATSNGVFEGEISESNTYYAIYPWRDNMTMTTEIFVNIPSRQTYRANSFDINMAPMVGRGNNEESIHFQNLCGILTLNLKGTDKISSITLSAKDARGNKAFLSGDFSVDMGYETFPYPMPTENALTEITLECKEGVQLDSETETSFNVIIPPGKYYGLELLIVTTDGKFMKKSTSNTLEIKRSVITKSRGFEFEDNLSGTVVNLNTYGHSNCYVVSSAGVYSFDATVIGNGEFGMVPGADFHTDSPDIAPVSVELLWEDRAGLIGGYAYDAAAGEVKFIASGKEGNALFAVKDEEGNILWSWHIWMTDQPVDQTYVNSAGTFVVQDRNLGATRADRGSGDEWKDAKGILYQWGRKDPFIFDDNGNGKPVGTLNSSRITIAESISDPACFAGGSSGWESSGSNVSLWLPSQKTIYDPCPVGYKVARKEIWSGFSKSGADVQNNLDEFNVSGDYDNGWDFYYDGVNITYIPATDVIKYNYSYEHRNHVGDLGSSDADNGVSAYRWYYEYTNESSNRIQLSSQKTAYALALRCMKDEGYIDVSEYLEVAKTIISDVTTSSAVFTSKYKYSYTTEVTEVGFIYGKEADLSDGIKVVSQTDNVSFSAAVDNLDNASVYYVQAYAVNAKGTSYSDIGAFATWVSDDIQAYDISKAGKANCYIVSSPGKYAFNCMFKGNSNESVGNPVLADLVWETKNTNSEVQKNEIIASVYLNGQYVVFETPEIFTPGNALIAVKDVEGNILWSWHIWVVDFDPVSTQQTYISGAVMMDRNLGALRSTPGDPSVNGMFYQWGRKDPLLGSYSDSEFVSSYPPGVKQYNAADEVGDMEYAIKNPATVSTKLYNIDTWGSHKTMYDPCPFGWRVPDGGPGVWNGITEHEMVGQGYYLYPPYSIPQAFYPAPGYTGAKPTIQFYGSAIYIWSCTPISSDAAYSTHYFYSTNDPKRKTGKLAEHPVRCMKDE